MPYMTALAVWTLAGLAALAPAMRLFFGRGRFFRLGLLAPAVAVNVALGQNGAFTAALLLSGLALWPRRPILAGILLGLLVFKPQLAVLLPVAVIADRRWTLMFAAAASASAVLVLSVLAFGVASWTAFFGPTLATQNLMLSHGTGPFQWMMPSVFMAARVLGAAAPTALLIQAPFAVLGAGAAWLAYRSPAPPVERAAVLILATFLATPQAFNYDLIPAAAAALVLLRRDSSIYGVTVVALLWALPVLLLAAQVVHLPLGPPILLLAAIRLAILCRIWPELKGSGDGPGGPSPATSPRTRNAAA
jgi:hypothetical protein